MCEDDSAKSSAFAPQEIDLTNQVLTEAPIEKPLETTVEILDDERGLCLQRFNGSLGAGVFLSLFWIGWTVGCAFMLRDALVEPSLSHLLFPIPFWAVWIGLPFLIRHQFKAVEDLLIGEQDVVYATGAPVPKPEQTVPRQEIRRVDTYVDRDFDSTIEESGVLIETTAQPIRFAVGASQDECEWLARLIRSRLNVLLDQRSESPVTTKALTKDVEVLEFDETPHPQPADSRIRCVHADGTAQFISLRQPWSGTVPLIGSLVLFVVSSAVFSGLFIDVVGNIRWDRVFPLLMFGLIAFGSACFSVSVLVRPWKRVTYAFSSLQIARRWQVGPFRHARFFPAENLDRLELRLTVNYTPSLPAHSTMFIDGRTDLPFSLAFVDDSEKDVLEIRNLTQPEARWMADVLLREYDQDWFSN